MASILQAGAIAVRRPRGIPEVLVVRARKNPQDWIFPKGHIEPGEDAPAAAVRELLEEAGVVGRVDRWVGTSRFTLGARRIEVSYYLVWYVGDGPAHELREKAWLSLANARTRLTFDDTRGFLDRVEQFVTGSSAR